MRTTADLIQELREETTSGRIIALAVGFQNSTALVFASDPNPLAKLNRLVKQGGTPVGFLAVTQGREGKVETRVLQEHSGDRWAEEYLTTLAYSFGAQLEAAGLGSVIEHKN